MNKTRLFSLFAVICSVAATNILATTKNGNAVTLSKAQQDMDNTNLSFIENAGQVVNSAGVVQSNILFIVKGGGTQVFLEGSKIHYQFAQVDYPKGYEPNERDLKEQGNRHELRQQIKTSTHRFTLSLEGANTHPKVREEQATGYFENYYLPQCPNGLTAKAYQKVVMENVYPGIDGVLYTAGSEVQQGLKYDFIVHPGADPALIQLHIIDADAVSITDAGELLMKTTLGEVSSLLLQRGSL